MEVERLLDTNDDVPVLEHGIVVDMGAVILEPVYLAKNIAVDANAIVNKSFEEKNIAIAGVPTKKLVIMDVLNGIKNRL